MTWLQIISDLIWLCACTLSRNVPHLVPQVFFQTAILPPPVCYIFTQSNVYVLVAMLELQELWTKFWKLLSLHHQV